jgi:hypothetical protein
MNPFAAVDPVFLDTIIGLLVPWFLIAAGGDVTAARRTAECILASYDVETEQEIRLAAEITSFGFGALEGLRDSMDPELKLNAVLRLRGSANTQHRSANQCQRTLDKLRKERRMAAEVVEAQPPVSEDRNDTPQAPQSNQTAPAQPRATITLSRQQRRAMQRAADKAQRKQTEQLRRDAMRATRTTPNQQLASPRGEPHRQVLAL